VHAKFWLEKPELASIFSYAGLKSETKSEPLARHKISA